MRTEIAIISALTLVLSMPLAFGEIVETKGQNYDLVENFFIGEAVWESHPERIMDGGWQNYALSNTGDKVIFNTNAVGSFVFDKNSCSYSIYGNGFDGEQIIPSVSAVATYLNNGQWQNLPINDEACTVTVDRYEDGVFLTSTKVITEDITEDVFIPYTGTTENFYVNATNANFDLIQSSNGTNIGYFNGETRVLESVEVEKFVQELRLDINSGFKETFKVWHDGSEELGISQTVHTGESITIGEQTINIAELNGQSFDRQYLEDNAEYILELTDSINYNFDIGIESLSNVNIIFDGDYKVNMDYASGITGVAESTPFIGYLEIDPSFTTTATSNSWSGSASYDVSSLPTTINVSSATSGHETLTASQISSLESNSGTTTSYDHTWASNPQYTSTSAWSNFAMGFSGWSSSTQLGAIHDSDLTNFGYFQCYPCGTASAVFDTGAKAQQTLYINQAMRVYTDQGSPNLTIWTSDSQNSGYTVHTTKDFGSGAYSDQGTGVMEITGDFRYMKFLHHNSSYDGSWKVWWLSSVDISQDPELSLTYSIPITPQPPTGLTTVTGVPIELDWTAPTDNGGSSITGYKVFRTLNEYALTELPDNSANSAGIDFTGNEFLTHGFESTTTADQSLEFDSSQSDYVAVPSLSVGYEFSASMWVMKDTAGRMSFMVDGQNNGIWLEDAEVSSTGLGLRVGHSQSGLDFDTTVDFPEDGNWHHLAFNVGTPNQIWLDGVSLGTGGSAQSTSTTFTPLLGGSLLSTGATQRHLDGALDDVAIWDRFLTTSEVASLYSGASPSTISSGLVAYYDMETVTSSTISDVTSNNNDGTNNGATAFDSSVTVTTLSDKSTNTIPITVNSGTSTTGVIGEAAQNPNLTFTDSNLPDNTDDFSVGSWVKLDESTQTSGFNVQEDGTMVTADQAFSSCADYTAVAAQPIIAQPRLQTPTSSGNQACHGAYWNFDLSSISGATVTSATIEYDVSTIAGSPSNCEWVGLTTTPPDGFTTYNDIMSGTVFATNDSSCTTTGTGKTVTLNSAGLSALTSSAGGDFNIGTTFVDSGQVRDSLEDQVRFTENTATLSLTYSAPPQPQKLLGLNDVTFNVGTDSASVVETTISYSTQGYAGGNGFNTDPYPHGGGGGAGQVGGNANNANTGGDGGDGLQSDITGTNIYYAGGGAGNTVRSYGFMGTAGQGSGGSTTWGANGANGLGGGGNGQWDAGGNGGTGGNGVVILQIPSGTSYSTTGSPTIDTTSVSGKIIIKYDSLSSSSLTINSAVDVRYLVVGGGGGASGAGGGAGGFSTGTLTALPSGTYTVIVGAGGAGSSGGGSLPASNGSDSVFASITSLGGGGAGGNASGSLLDGLDGGSGGGAGKNGIAGSATQITNTNTNTIITATGLTDNTSTPQHYTFTRSANDWAIYQNGASEATVTDTTSLGSNLEQVSVPSGSAYHQDFSSYSATGILNNAWDESSDSSITHTQQSACDNADWTVIMWYKSNGSTDTTTRDAIWAWSSNGITAWFVAQNDKIGVGVYGGTAGNTWNDQYSTVSLGDNQWHQVAVVNDGATQTYEMFVDGTSDHSGTSDNYYGGNNCFNMDTISKSSLSNNGYYLDEFSYHSSKLTQAEIQASWVKPNYTTELDGMIDEYFINSDVLTSTEVDNIYDRGVAPTQIATTGSTTTDYDDSSVTGGTEYYYTVKATNAVGDSDFLTPFVSALAGTPPDVPTSVSSTINSPNTAPLDITVSWSAPTNVGSGTLTGFEIYRDSTLITTTGLVSSYTDTVPTGGGTFEYKLKAVSTHGTSGFSSTTSTTTPTVPPAPTNAPALAINNPNPSPLDIEVSWTEPASGGSIIQSYEVFRSADDVTYTSVGTVTDLDFTDTVPSAGTWYYKFTSINLVGSSGLSPSNSITTASVPSSPLNASSVIPSINSAPYDVTVSWDLPTSTGGSALTGYNVYRQTGSGAFSLITTTTALGYVDTVPTALNQDYTFKIHAVNNVGESTTFTTTTITTGDVPDAPTLSFTTGTTALSWTVPNSDASITGYEIFRDGSLLTTVTTTSHSDFTPINFGQSYQYEVQAVSSLGNSVDSNSIVTTPETEITGMIVQGITGTGAVIDWNEPAYYQGQITSYSVYYATPATSTNPAISAGTTTNTYSNFAPTLDYDTSYTFGVTINSPLGNSGFSNLVNATTGVDNSIVAYDPNTGGMNWFDIDSVSEQTVNVIEFQRETQNLNVNGTFTDVDTLQVGYPSWWDSMTCNVDYKFAQKTEQYVEGTDMTAVVNSADANQQVIGFQFQDIDNEVIEVECAPQQSQQDDGVSAKYIMTQTNLSTGMPNIPLVTQIQAFQTGDYGTDGEFGALDVVGLFVILISMVGFNRLSPIVGVLLSASLVFGLSFFGIISLPTVLVGIIALVIFLAWGITRNR